MLDVAHEDHGDLGAGGAALGVEDRLADLGSIDASAFEEHVGDMAEAALGDRCTPTNPRPVSRQDLVNLYRDAYNG